MPTPATLGPFSGPFTIDDSAELSAQWLVTCTVTVPTGSGETWFHWTPPRQPYPPGDGGDPGFGADVPCCSVLHAVTSLTGSTNTTSITVYKCPYGTDVSMGVPGALDGLTYFAGPDNDVTVPDPSVIPPPDSIGLATAGEGVGGDGDEVYFRVAYTATGGGPKTLTFEITAEPRLSAGDFSGDSGSDSFAGSPDIPPTPPDGWLEPPSYSTWTGGWVAVTDMSSYNGTLYPGTSDAWWRWIPSTAALASTVVFTIEGSSGAATITVLYMPPGGTSEADLVNLGLELSDVGQANFHDQVAGTYYVAVSRQYEGSGTPDAIKLRVLTVVAALDGGGDSVTGVQAIEYQPKGLEAVFLFDVMDNQGKPDEEMESVPWGDGLWYVFNDYGGLAGGDALGSGGSGFYVHEIGGTDDADVRDSREVRPSRHGEDAYNALYGGRTLTFTGELRATNLRQLRRVWQELRWAFVDLKEHYLVFYNDYVANDVMIKCRKSTAMSGREVQDRNYFKRDVLLTLRASEPWFVSRGEHSASHEPTQTFTLGRVYTREFDDRYTHYLDNENDVVDDITAFSVSNLGNFEAYPRFVLNGPMEAPIIQNMNTGETMYLLMNIPDDETVTIDIQNRTITDSAGHNLFSVLSPLSDWITLAPGDNNLAITVRTFIEGSDALATVFWRDTWI